MKNIEELIKQENLISNNETIGVACSGGRDSMALLHFLDTNKAAFGCNIAAVNIDHNIRPESKNDSMFVKEYCKQHNIKCLSYSLDVLKYCKEKGITTVYDNNYRAKLWSVEQAGAAFKEILPYVDILSAGYLDAQNFLGLKSEHSDFEDMLADLYAQMKAMYPNLRYITSTRRQIISTSVNKLTGYLYTDRLHVSPTYHIDDIVDRVGGGDAYISGLLYGLLNGKDAEYCLQFGCCASVLKHTIHGDANLFSVKEIENFMAAGTSAINR